MSYSLMNKCGACKKKVNCIDSAIIMGAITAIHSVNWNGGVAHEPQPHQGAGTITMNCCRFEDEKVIAEEPKD